MSTDAATKVTNVTAPAAPAKPAPQSSAPAKPATSAPATPQRSPEQIHTQNRADRIKAAVEAANQKKADAASAPQKTDAPAAKPASDKPAEAPKDVTVDKVEPPTVIKLEADKPDKPAATEADPIDEWKLPANASAESIKNFADIRTEAKARKQREQQALAKVTELETQLTTYRNASPADSAAMDSLKLQLKDAHDRLAVVDLKSHPDFIRQYVEPVNASLAEAREVLAYNTKEGDAVPDLGALLTKPAKEFNAEVAKMTKDMNSVDANIVISSLRNAHKLNAKQSEVLGKSGELATKLQQQSAQLAKAAFEEVSKNLGPAGDFLQPLEIVDGLTPEDKAAAEAYNASLSGVRANAEKLAFGRIDEKGVATMAYKAATLEHMISHTIPRVQAEFRKVAKICAQQAEVIKSLRGGAGPDAGKGGGGGDGSVDVSKMSIEQRVKFRLAEANRAKQR